MKAEWVDEIVEKELRKRPGATRTRLAIIVAVHFPASSPRDVSFMMRRDELLLVCLQSGKYENRGRPNKHAWSLKNAPDNGVVEL